MLKNSLKLLFASSLAVVIGASSADSSYAVGPTIPVGEGAPEAARAVSPEFAANMDAYLSNDANIEKIGNALERYFVKKQQQQMEAQKKSEEQAREEAFKNPLKIDVANAPIKGNPNAKITIVEVSDFQCPFCTKGSKVMEEVLKAYPNDVKIAFVNFPLVDMHPQAKPAAIAALAANEQGKFWEMHDLLFANQRELNEESYLKFATQLGLKMDKFKADLKSEKLAQRVDEDLKKGKELGVQGTPGFFVNGVAVRGAYPFPHFKEIIDRWLQILNAGQPAAAAPAPGKK